MKRVLLFLLVAILVLSMFAGCAKTASSSKDTPTFMFCISHMTNAWAKEAAESMEAAAEAAGAEMIVNEAGKDINKQVSQIESGINQKVDAIIIEPVSADGVLPAVEAAMDKGIPVIIFNQAISDLSKATCFVGVSNEDGGYMEMSRAIEDLGGKGNVALLLGPLGSEGQMGRSAGYQKAMDENPDVKVAFEETANWTTEEALKLVENWLQTGTEINAVVAQNDGMALGAVKAIEDKNLGDQIKVYGLDAVPDALQAVKDGRLAITVSQETSKQSQSAVEAAMKLYNGEEVDAKILVDFGIIDETNVDQYLN